MHPVSGLSKRSCGLSPTTPQRHDNRFLSRSAKLDAGVKSPPIRGHFAPVEHRCTRPKEFFENVLFRSCEGCPTRINLSIYCVGADRIAIRPLRYWDGRNTLLKDNFLPENPLNRCPCTCVCDGLYWHLAADGGSLTNTEHERSGTDERATIMLNLKKITQTVLFLTTCAAALATPGDGLARMSDELVAEGTPAANVDEIRQLIYDMETAYEGVHDYTTIFYKKERIRGRMIPQEKMLLKFRKPFSVYLKWLSGKRSGQETLFVQGWNSDKILAHPGSFPDVTVSLRPTSSLAMRGNRHAITEVGIGNTIRLIVRDFRLGQIRKDDVKLYDHGISQIYGERSRCVEAVTPERKVAKFYAPRAKICVNLKTGLPNKVQVWDRQGNLIEDYGFSNTQLNTGLSSGDFDPSNTEYGF